MRESCTTSASAPTSGICSASYRGWIGTPISWCCQCRPEDRKSLASLGENFRAVVETAGNYSIAEQVKVPLALKREGVTTVPCAALRAAAAGPLHDRSVTIHDCIHLMFPQYLPNRIALGYARVNRHGGANARPAVVDGFGKLEARHPAISSTRSPTRSTSSTTPTTIGSESNREKKMSSGCTRRFQLHDEFVLYAGNVKPHKNVERLIRGVSPACGNAALIT